MYAKTCTMVYPQFHITYSYKYASADKLQKLTQASIEHVSIPEYMPCMTKGYCYIRGFLSSKLYAGKQ